MFRMLKITWAQAANWRLHRQHLDGRARKGNLLAVASRLCGLHAQVLSCAELTAWARIENLDRAEVQQALWEERTLVKTWAMRGTLHLLPSSELPVWHAALGTSRRYLRPNLWEKYFGITLDQLDRLSAAIGEALSNRVLTREELVREVTILTGRKCGSKLGESSWGTILKPAAFSGWLCFGPSQGQRVRFTHPDTWLEGVKSSSRPLDPQTATAAITRRFLSAYGPATYRDLARWWGGGGIATARKWISDLGDEVCPVDLRGSSAWMLAADARKVREVPQARSVRLLPGFDQYVVTASCHADQLLPGDLRSRVYRPQGWISPVLLVNGFMRGTWRHELKGSRIEVTVEPFVDVPTRVRRAANHEAERLADYLGGALNVSWKDPSAVTRTA